MPSPILVPSNTLILPAPRSLIRDAADPPPRFILFGTQWLDLQGFVAKAMALPINQGEWDQKYGEFDQASKDAVQNCLKAFANIKGLSARFGDPVALKQSIVNDPAYLQTAAPPAAIYA